MYLFTAARTCDEAKRTQINLDNVAAVLSGHSSNKQQMRVRQAIWLVLLTWFPCASSISKGTLLFCNSWTSNEPFKRRPIRNDRHTKMQLEVASTPTYTSKHFRRADVYICQHICEARSVEGVVNQFLTRGQAKQQRRQPLQPGWTIERDSNTGLYYLHNPSGERKWTNEAIAILKTYKFSDEDVYRALSMCQQRSSKLFVCTQEQRQAALKNATEIHGFLRDDRKTSIVHGSVVPTHRPLSCTLQAEAAM